MGTPEFAVSSLQKLVEQKFDVIAVVTAPDKPKGRGKKLGTSPVKDYAVAVGLPILQPTNLKDPEFIDQLKSYQADLQIIVAFRMLPEVVWSMPKIGSFNLHGSLLPQYRGAAPIHWAVIKGETETGVTTFMLKHEIDTGNILFQEKEPIYKEDTTGSVYDRLMQKGADLVIKTIRAIEAGDFELTPQDETGVIKHAPKIFREDCKINWSLPGEEIRNFVRGLNPFPSAWTRLDQKNLKVHKIEVSDEKANKDPGFLEINDKLGVHTKDRIIYLTELQMEGKKRMHAEEFLRGYKINSITINSVS